jgi:hypothetical protein
VLPITAFPELVVRDAELVDMAVEGIGETAHVPSDAKESGIERDRCRIALLSNARRSDRDAGCWGRRPCHRCRQCSPRPRSRARRDVVLQAVVRPEEIPGEAPAVVIEDVAALFEADDGLGGTGASSSKNTRLARPSCYQVATIASAAAIVARMVCAV